MEEQRERIDPDEYVFRSAECHSSKLFGHFGYTRTDVEEIRADLIAYLWERSNRWNPERGKWSTFVTNVMRNRVINIITHRCSRKRDYRLEVSYEYLMSERNHDNDPQKGTYR